MNQSPYFTEDMYEMVDEHNKIVELLDEKSKTSCKLSYTDSYPVAKKKCARAYTRGAYFLPLVTRVLAPIAPSTDDGDDSDGGDSGGVAEDMLTEAKSSTERVRKYYKKHPKKVSQYLKKTVDDRTKRNKDRAAAVDKHGETKMANHDVHHPDGPDGGHWKLAKKDHGPDKKADKKKSTKKTPSKKATPKAPKKAPKAPKKAPKAPKKTPKAPKKTPKAPSTNVSKHPHLTHILQNPKTAKDVLIATALHYPKNHPLYKAAVEFIRLLLLAYPEDHPLYKIASQLETPN